ncbi:hypothetical protein C8Q79DRAFT_1012723 [Trametes meyenii]|nr:hypothetical protein C8Q79DRAFT_1012723 [Trametes meyenii]
MSSSVDAAWRSVGRDTIRSFVAVTVKTFIIGLYSVLIYMTGRLLLHKHRSKMSYWTASAVLIMFAMVLALWIIDIHNVIAEVQLTLLSNSTDSPAAIYAAAKHKLTHLAYAEDILYAFLTNVGDSIIIWRVYAFWSTSQGKWVLILPLACLLGSLTTSVLVTYCATGVGANIEQGAFRDPPFCRNVQTASYAMTLVTTAVATALIAYKTWEYRRLHKEAFGKYTQQTRSQKVMLLLIESGILYFLFFLVQVILTVKPVHASVAKHPNVGFGLTIWDFNTSVIVGMYPTLIVILAHSKHSILHTEADAEDHTPYSGIVFKSTRRTEVATASTSTTRATRAPHATTVDLYEMSRVSSAGSGKARATDVKGGGGLEVRIRRSVEVEAI